MWHIALFASFIPSFASLSLWFSSVYAKGALQVKHLHAWSLVWNRTWQPSFGNGGGSSKRWTEPLKAGYVKDEETAPGENPCRRFLFCLLGLGIHTNPLKWDHKTSHGLWCMCKFGKMQSKEQKDLKQVSFWNYSFEQGAPGQSMRVCFCYGHKNHKSDSCCYSDAQCCQGNGFRHLAYTGKGGRGWKRQGSILQTYRNKFFGLRIKDFFICKAAMETAQFLL